MIEIHTKDDLRRALYKNEDVIHIEDRNLCLGIIKSPYKFRQILFAYQTQGYRLVKQVCCGSFDVKLVRKDAIDPIDP